jgi:hypothetical protein
MASATSSKKVVFGCAPYVPSVPSGGKVTPHNTQNGGFVYILTSGEIWVYININVDYRTDESKYCVVFPGTKPEGIHATILKQFNLVTAIPSGKSGEKTLFKLSVSIAGSKPVGTIGDHFRAFTSSPYIGFAIDTQNGFTIQEKTIAVVMKNRKHQKSTMVQEFFQILFDGIYTGSISIPDVQVKNLPKVVELQVSSNSFPALPGQKTVVPETAMPVTATAMPVVETATPVTATATPIIETATPVLVTATPVIETATPVTATAMPVLPITEANSVLTEDDIYAYKYRLLELEMSKLSAEHYLKKLKVSLNSDFTEDEKDSCDEQILGITRDLVTFKREQRAITNALTGGM